MSADRSLEAIVLSRTVTEVEVVPSYLYGDVTIDPSAVIAPGVLLQAEPYSQIIIGAGVCVGLGTIIHAVGGRLELKAGVCVSTEVLILGQGSIGDRACVGARSTTIDPQINAGEIVPPDSLLGDRSRSVDLTVKATTFEPIPDPFDDEPSPTGAEPAAETIEYTVTETQTQTTTTTASSRSKSVAGKSQFDLLKRKLFN
jgi:carbon dioxide concentrating mechanism protein CcmN